MRTSFLQDGVIDGAVMSMSSKTNIMSSTMLRAFAAAAVFAFATTAAHATPIFGSIMFSDHLAATSGSANTAGANVVAGASTLAQACTGVFAAGMAGCRPSPGTSASSFTLADPLSVPIVYTYNNFVFTVTAMEGSVTNTGGSLGFVGTGTVTGPAGFDAAPFTIVWNANTTSGYWVARLNAAAPALPEPGTVALIGIAMMALALLRRRSVS